MVERRLSYRDEKGGFHGFRGTWLILSWHKESKSNSSLITFVIICEKGDSICSAQVMKRSFFLPGAPMQ